MNHTLFFTLTIDHLSWKSLVYMRCCSKNWRQEIDKHIQLNAIKRNENPSIINRAAIEDGRCVICFEKSSNAFWHSIWNIHAHAGCLINQLKDSCELTHISSDILNKLPSQDLPQNVETIRTENGRLKHTDFGARGMSDFTKHKDKERRSRYITRHSKDLSPAGFWIFILISGLLGLIASSLIFNLFSDSSQNQTPKQELIKKTK